MKLKIYSEIQVKQALDFLRSQHKKEIDKLQLESSFDYAELIEAQKELSDLKSKLEAANKENERLKLILSGKTFHDKPPF